MEQTKERGINAFFDETPVKHLVIKLGIPAMFAQFFNILYSIVDRIFVGRIPEGGDLALASIGVCAPALTAISAFAYMVGVGGASQMSIRSSNALCCISWAVTTACILWQADTLPFMPQERCSRFWASA